ncbi:TM7S3/TM198-like domain-containing protein [Pseudoxanthomonas sp. 10H]|uniref:TM7S3/TM198-like domain-containing protein n=1 Tax=Pseudoxanthomonas sp. 10H TaxID=3242729 RepID=UPI003556F556
MDYAFFWGVVAIACGTVMIVYGASMFRVVLAFAGFYIGFGVVSAVLGSMTTGPGPLAQSLVAIVLGAALGGLLYSFVAITVYAAGAILGLVVALFFTSLVGIGGSWLLSVLALAGAGLGAFGGRYLGSWLMILSSAFAGAYFSVSGLSLLFGMQAPNGMMPINSRTLVVFALLATISFLAQARTRNLRRSGVFVR